MKFLKENYLFTNKVVSGGFISFILRKFECIILLHYTYANKMKTMNIN